MQVLNDTDASSVWSSTGPGSGMSSIEAQWMEEARCLMLLNHRSVVRLVGVIASSRPMYIVTELAAHGNLKECLRHNDVFTVTDIRTLLNVCVQVAPRSSSSSPPPPPPSSSSSSSCFSNCLKTYLFCRSLLFSVSTVVLYTMWGARWCNG